MDGCFDAKDHVSSMLCCVWCVVGSGNLVSTYIELVAISHQSIVQQVSVDLEAHHRQLQDNPPDCLLHDSQSL